MLRVKTHFAVKQRGDVCRENRNGTGAKWLCFQEKRRCCRTKPRCTEEISRDYGKAGELRGRASRHSGPLCESRSVLECGGRDARAKHSPRRHRFPEASPLPKLGCPAVEANIARHTSRKRCRRYALPPHSKTLSRSSEIALSREPADDGVWRAEHDHEAAAGDGLRDGFGKLGVGGQVRLVAKDGVDALGDDVAFDGGAVCGFRCGRARL